eukprot:scaffold7331_cov61-Cyclotella_meneghiniana.AAC.1
MEATAVCIDLSNDKECDPAFGTGVKISGNEEDENCSSDSGVVLSDLERKVHAKAVASGVQQQKQQGVN